MSRFLIDTPTCPQQLVLGVSRRSFLFGLITGAAVTIAAMHVQWTKPDTGPIGDVPSPPPGPLGDSPVQPIHGPPLANAPAVPKGSPVNNPSGARFKGIRPAPPPSDLPPGPDM